MIARSARKLSRGKRAIVTVEVDRLGRLFVRVPQELAFKKVARFKVKLIGRQAILLKRPVRERDVKKINVDRWKSMRHG